MFKLVVLSALLAMSLAAPAPEPAPAPAPAPAPKPSGGFLAYAAPPVAVFHSAPLIHAPLVPAAISSQYTAVYHGAKAVPVHEAHIAAIPLAHPGLVISPYAVHAL